MSSHHSYPSIQQDNDQGHSSAPQSNVQPPLRPTGFIQGEHGTLIPIYHPEALDQYMANSQHTQTPPPLTQTQNPIHPPSAWNPYAQSPMYPYTMHAPPIASSLPQQRAWMPSPSSSLAFPAAQHHPIHNPSGPYGIPMSSSGPLMTGAPAFRHAYPAPYHHGRRNTPPPKRFGRKDHQAFNGGYNTNYTRITHSTHNRFGRVGNELSEP